MKWRWIDTHVVLYDDATSEFMCRHIAWLDCLYVDIYQWKRRIVARVGSVLAPFQQIPVTAIRTMPTGQPGWVEYLLVLQDGTRLYGVHVSSVVADIQSMPVAITNEETTTIRKIQSKRYPQEKVDEWYRQRVEDFVSKGKFSSRGDYEKARQRGVPEYRSRASP